VSFGVPINGTDYEIGFTPVNVSQSTFISQIQTLQGQGKKVLLSIGGANDPVKLDNTTERDVFVSSVTSLLNTYGFDGIDIDFEGSSLSVSSSSTIANPTDAHIINLIDAIKSVMVNYRSNFNNKKMHLTFAPETAFVQGGMSSWGGLWGAYLPVLHALRDSIDLLQVQLYNSGSMYGIDGNTYNQGTADFIVAMSEALIQGFDVPLSGNQAGPFIGLPEAKIAVGLPACPSAAGGGYTAPATVKAAIDYLRGVGPKPGSYTLQGGPYPNMKGMMTWSINWDAVTTCNATAYEYAASFENIFLFPCWQPNLGNDVSACVTSFPYTLNSGTTTNTNVTFTWKNLTTGQVLVQNSPTATTWSVSAPAVYQVVRDSAGCSKSDDISILNDLATPDLPASEDICGQVPLSLSPANLGSFPGSTSWQWYKDGTAMSGETNATLTGIRFAAAYKLTAQYGSCNTEKTTTVTSSLPTPVDDCVPPGSSAQLSIQTSSSGPFNWYATSTGGSSLGTGTTYTTPALNATTTYYVEDSSSPVSTTTTGPPTTNNGLGTLQNYASPTTIIFDADKAFTLKEITVYPAIWCFTHTLSFEIRDASDNVLTNGAQSFSITDDSDCNTITGAVTLVLSNGGVNIPAGTGYKIVKTGSVGFNFWEGSVSYPMSYSPYFTITGGSNSNQYMAVHDWKVEAGCARMPVIAEVNASCMALPIELVSFTAEPDGNGALLRWRTADESNNRGFFVLRKTDTSPLDTIGWVDAVGPRHDYRFRDPNLLSGITWYYQLLQVDFDNQVSLSPFVSLRINGNDVGFSAFPNPASERLHLRHPNANHDEPALVSLYDLQGSLLSQTVWEGSETSLDISSLPRGSYLLVVVSDGKVEREIIVIE